jgi:hypothetical protein
VATDLDSLKQAYLDNADYDTDVSLEKVNAFITACRRLLLVRPKVVHSGGGTGMEFAPQYIEMELDHAVGWRDKNMAELSGGTSFGAGGPPVVTGTLDLDKGA